MMLTWLTLMEPCSTVPVMTVPWPRMLKQWSTEKTSGSETARGGMYTCLQSSSTSAVTPETRP